MNQPVAEQRLAGPGENLFKMALMSITLAVVALVAISAFVTARYGSIGNATAVVRGQPLMVTPREKSIGSQGTNKEIRVQFNLQNVGNSSIKLVGFKTSCDCVFTDHLPMTLQAGERRQVAFGILTSSKGGAFKRVVRIYTDLPTQPRLDLAITGTVQASL